jgi:probable rRNA maturation factor
MDPDSSRRPPGRRAAALDVEVLDARGRTLRAGGLARWLRGIAPASARGALAVAIVPDAQVRNLNRTYRHKDAATDVLSFPSDTPGVLGDIVIARGIARQQAREHGHPLETELRILALHGLLHLLGYDHDAVRDRGRMRRTEERLRRRGGLPSSLTGRTIPSARR